MELRGSFLIAMPDLADPNFHRTVVLVVEHDDDDGTVGLVLNRPTEIEPGEFCDGLEIHWEGDESERVHSGGPVQPSMGWILHGEREDIVDSGRVTKGLWASTSLRTLEHIAAEPSLRRRIYGGYAGWAPGQLMGEIRAGAWLTCPAVPDLVFHDRPEAVWELALRSIGIDPLALVSAPREVS